MDSDFQTVRNVNGIYVGQLTTEEMLAFNRLCERGYAERVYECPGGFMGMAKVRLNYSPWAVPR